MRSFMEMSNLINEALYGPFSDNFNYFPPQNFEILLADFYGLTAIRNQLRNIATPGEPELGTTKALKLFQNIENAHDKTTLELKDYLLKAIPYIVSVELRHLQMEGSEFLKKHQNDSDNIEKLRNLFKSIKQTGHSGYSKYDKNDVFLKRDIYNQEYDDYEFSNIDPNFNHPELNNAKDFLKKEKESEAKIRNVKNQLAYHNFFINHFGSTDELMNFAKWSFAQKDLWQESYGGEPWQQIVKYYEILKKTEGIHEVVQVIDQIIDLEHNTGSAFNKIDHLRKKNETYSFGWFTKFLDEKAQYPTPYGYFEKMSEKAQQLVGAFYKAKEGLTYEMHQKLVDYHDPYRLKPPLTNLSNRKEEPAYWDELHSNYQKYKQFIKSPLEIIPKKI